MAGSLPGLFVKLLMMIISTFFIALDYDRIASFFVRQLSENGRTIFWEIKDYVTGTLFVCIRSYAIIMSITFVELSIGLSIIGIENAVMIALLIAVFDILPVLGTGGIMIPWAVITAIQGEYKLAIALFAVYIVVTIIRNIIEPKIVGSQLGLHPVATLASLFVGAQLFGAVGLFGFRSAVAAALPERAGHAQNLQIDGAKRKNRRTLPVWGVRLFGCPGMKAARKRLFKGLLSGCTTVLTKCAILTQRFAAYPAILWFAFGGRVGGRLFHDGRFKGRWIICLRFLF